MGISLEFNGNEKGRRQNMVGIVGDEAAQNRMGRIDEGHFTFHKDMSEVYALKNGPANRSAGGWSHGHIWSEANSCPTVIYCSPLFSGR